MCSSRSEQTLTMSDSESDFSNDCVSVGGEDSSGDTGDSSSDSDDNPGTSFSKRSRFDMEIPDPDSYDPGLDDRVAQRERQHGQEGAARRRPLWEASKQASLLSTPSSSRPESPQPLLGRLTPSLLGANTGSLSTPSHDSQAGTSRQRTVQGPLGGAERPDTPPIANLSVQPEADDFVRDLGARQKLTADGNLFLRYIGETAVIHTIGFHVKLNLLSRTSGR